MGNHKGREGTARRIAAVALSVGAIGATVGVTAGQDALGAVRAQFETAFTPGAEAAGSNSPGLIEGGPGMVEGGPGMVEGGPGLIIE